MTRKIIPLPVTRETLEAHENLIADLDKAIKLARQRSNLHMLRHLKRAQRVTLNLRGRIVASPQGVSAEVMVADTHSMVTAIIKVLKKS